MHNDSKSSNRRRVIGAGALTCALSLGLVGLTAGAHGASSADAVKPVKPKAPTITFSGVDGESITKGHKDSL